MQSQFGVKRANTLVIDNLDPKNRNLELVSHEIAFV